jgi:hypothetical protein
MRVTQGPSTGASDIDPSELNPLRELDPAVLREEFRAQAQSRMAGAVDDMPLGKARRYPAPDDPSFAGVNAKAAAVALAAVRHALHDRSAGSAKSTNKWSKGQPDPFLAVEERLNLSEFRELLDDDDPLMKHRFEAAASSANAWAGLSRNCAGLTRAAQDYLERFFPEIQTTRVVFQDDSAMCRVDHTMTVVGAFDPAWARRPMTAWPAHLIVCDPWANIACPAPEYSRRFQDKMRKWEADGKQVRFKGTSWQSPTLPSWMTCPDRIDRVLIGRRHASGESLARGVKAERAPEDASPDVSTQAL